MESGWKFGCSQILLNWPDAGPARAGAEIGSSIFLLLFLSIVIFLLVHALYQFIEVYFVVQLSYKWNKSL